MVLSRGCSKGLDARTWGVQEPECLARPRMMASGLELEISGQRQETNPTIAQADIIAPLGEHSGLPLCF
jgi:hypothetical protein